MVVCGYNKTMKLKTKTILLSLGTPLVFSCAGMEVLEDDVEFVFDTWCAPNQEVEVTRVYDGDTFMYVDQNGVEQTIRMLGVAAPEIASSEGPGECYGTEATEFLTDLLLGEEVRLEFDQECTDMFQRTLSWVVLRGDDPQVSGMMKAEMMGLNSDGSYEVLVNELLVQMGYENLSVKWTNRFDIQNG